MKNTKNTIYLLSTMIGILLTIGILRIDIQPAIQKLNFESLKQFVKESYLLRLHSRELEVQVSQVTEKICSSAGLKTGDPIVTEDERSSGKSNLEGGQSSENSVAEYMKSKDSAPLVSRAITLAAPWLVLFIISFFGYCCYCCCSACDCCCPPSKCCRHQDPYKKFELIWPAIGTTCTIIMLFAVGIVGLAQQKDIEIGVNKVMCSVVLMVDNVRNGAGSGVETFDGVVKLSQQISNFGNVELPKFQSQVKSKLSATPQNLAWRTTATTSATNSINSLDGMTGKTYSSGVVGPSTLFSTPIWGPKSNSNSVSGLADKFWNSMKGGIETAIDSIYNLATPFSDSLTSITKIINDSTKTLGDLVKTLDDAMKTFDDYNNQINQYTPMITQAVMGIAAFGLVVSLGVAAVLVVIYLMKKRGIRKVLHLCWVIIGPIMFLSLIITTIMHPVAVLLIDTCDVIDLAIHNEVSWDSYGLMDGTIKTCKRFTTCAPGNANCTGSGDILTKLGVTEQTWQISNFTKDIEDAQTKTLNSANTKQFLDDAFVQYDTLIRTVQYTKDYSAYRFNGTSGSTAQQTESLALDTVLSSVNTFLQRNPGGCVQLLETMYAGASCSSPSYASDISTIQNNIGGSQCVQIDSYASKATSTDYAKERYSGTGASGQCVNCDLFASNPATCTSAFQTDVGNVMKFVAQKNGYCTTALAGLNNIRTQISLYGDKLDLTQADVQVFLTSTIELIKIATNVEYEKGLLHNLNCLFIDSAIERLYDGVCISFVSAVWNLTQVLIVFSIALFFGSFFLFCTALRNGRTEDDQEAAKVNPADGMGEQGQAMNNETNRYGQY